MTRFRAHEVLYEIINSGIIEQDVMDDLVEIVNCICGTYGDQFTLCPVAAPCGAALADKSDPNWRKDGCVQARMSDEEKVKACEEAITLDCEDCPSRLSAVNTLNQLYQCTILDPDIRESVASLMKIICGVSGQTFEPCPEKCLRFCKLDECPHCEAETLNGYEFVSRYLSQWEVL